MRPASLTTAATLPRRRASACGPAGRFLCPPPPRRCARASRVSQPRLPWPPPPLPPLCSPELA
uniref:Uncharacterized protein n=1 Tax=Macrostomum lignano TaxID=282301 RepID=A0A1I8HGS4_9PLAT